MKIIRFKLYEWKIILYKWKLWNTNKKNYDKNKRFNNINKKIYNTNFTIYIKIVTSKWKHNIYNTNGIYKMKIKVFLQSINKLKIISLHIKKHTLNTVLKITETIQSTFKTFRGTY